jgi:colanic acid/amylovoran biosynthesis glycosyltransferase
MKRKKPESNKPRSMVRFSAAEPPRQPDIISEEFVAAPVNTTQAQLPRREDGFTFAYLCERLPSFVQTFVYREIEEMARFGMKPFVASIRRPDDPPEMAVAMSTPVFYLPEGAEIRTKIDKDRELGRLHFKLHRAIPKYRGESDSQRMFEAAWLGPILEAAGIRHVHAHFGGLAARTAWWLRKLFGFTYSFTGHANDIFCENDFPVSNEKLVRNAKFVATETDYSRRWLEEKYPFARGKIFRVFNGIRMDGLPEARPAEGVPRIVSVGRYVEKKGFPTLIEACAILKKKGVSFECEIIGGGELEGPLAAQIAKLELGECVKLLGPRAQSEVRERIAAARVFALACQKERDGGSDNLPTVIMEAMAIGVPCISTRLAGVPEMIDDNDTGLLTEVNDVQAFAEALEKLLVDAPLARHMGAVGARRAREKFSSKANAIALAGLLVRYAPVDAPSALLSKQPKLKVGFWRRLVR